jgi:HK97 family phage major capsid protein
MEKLEEMRIERTQKVERMDAILEKADTESRELSKEEETEFNNLEKEVRGLTTKIQRAERMQMYKGHVRNKGGKSNRQDMPGGDDDEPAEDPSQFQRSGDGPHIRKKTEPYSVGKAIREFSRGGEDGLTGLEAEQHQELSRGVASEGLLVPFENTYQRDQNTTSGADTIDTIIDPRLSIIGKKPLWGQMGLTVLPGLQGQLKIGKKAADEAEKVAEKGEITQTANEPTFTTMSPERYGITDIFTKELLVQRNPAVQAAIVNDMVQGCDRKISADVYTIALAAASEVAAGALSIDGFNALMAEVDLDGAFAMNRGTFYETKGTKVDTGSGKFMASLTGENGVGVTYDGVPIFYSTLFANGTNQQYLVYGAWNEIYLGFWGALEILINPFTYQKKGQIEMTVNRLADIACRNSGAFVKSPDLDATT